MNSQSENKNKNKNILNLVVDHRIYTPPEVSKLSLKTPLAHICMVSFTNADAHSKLYNLYFC